jgi:hypothetical protein
VSPTGYIALRWANHAAKSILLIDAIHHTLLLKQIARFFDVKMEAVVLIYNDWTK